MRKLLPFIGLWIVTAMVQGVHADKKILLIAGAPSHGPGDHEFRAGCLLLKSCLDTIPGVTTEVHDMGWPESQDAFDGADAVFIYADGGGGHPAVQGDRLKFLDALADKGVGLGFGHYGVEVEAGPAGDAFLKWIGGHYEHGFSVNPMWSPDFDRLPTHPVTRGVNPFSVLDEWYFNMRFRDDRAGITDILVAKPSAEVRGGPYVWPKGPYPHIQDAAGREETMMWLRQRDNGSRGFGFTGGHKHVNWGNKNYRKVVLNALLWIAKAEVPENGVTADIQPRQIAQNLDKKKNPPPANVSGKWRFTVAIGDNTGDPTFVLMHAGGSVIGAYSGFFGTADVTGSVKSRNIEFRFDATYDGNRFPVTYTGVIESESAMRGTVSIGPEISGTWTATRTDI